MEQVNGFPIVMLKFIFVITLVSYCLAAPISSGLDDDSEEDSQNEIILDEKEGRGLEPHIITGIFSRTQPEIPLKQSILLIEEGSFSLLNRPFFIHLPWNQIRMTTKQSTEEYALLTDALISSIDGLTPSTNAPTQSVQLNDAAITSAQMLQVPSDVPFLTIPDAIISSKETVIQSRNAEADQMTPSTDSLTLPADAPVSSTDAPSSTPLLNVEDVSKVSADDSPNVTVPPPPSEGDRGIETFSKGIISNIFRRPFRTQTEMPPEEFVQIEEGQFPFVNRPFFNRLPWNQVRSTQPPPTIETDEVPVILIDAPSDDVLTLPPDTIHILIDSVAASEGTPTPSKDITEPLKPLLHSDNASMPITDSPVASINATNSSTDTLKPFNGTLLPINDALAPSTGTPGPSINATTASKDTRMPSTDGTLQPIPLTDAPLILDSLQKTDVRTPSKDTLGPETTNVTTPSGSNDILPGANALTPSKDTATTGGLTLSTDSPMQSTGTPMLSTSTSTPPTPLVDVSLTDVLESRNSPIPSDEISQAMLTSKITDSLALSTEDEPTPSVDPATSSIPTTDISPPLTDLLGPTNCDKDRSQSSEAATISPTQLTETALTISSNAPAPTTDVEAKSIITEILSTDAPSTPSTQALDPTISTKVPATAEAQKPSTISSTPTTGMTKILAASEVPIAAESSISSTDMLSTRKGLPTELHTPLTGATATSTESQMTSTELSNQSESTISYPTNAPVLSAETSNLSSAVGTAIIGEPVPSKEPSMGEPSSVEQTPSTGVPTSSTKTFDSSADSLMTSPTTKAETSSLKSQIKPGEVITTLAEAQISSINTLGNSPDNVMLSSSSDLSIQPPKGIMASKEESSIKTATLESSADAQTTSNGSTAAAGLPALSTKLESMTTTEEPHTSAEGSTT